MEITKFNVCNAMEKNKKGGKKCDKGWKVVLKVNVSCVARSNHKKQTKNQAFTRKLLDITTTSLYDVENTQLKAWKPNGD